LKKDDELLYITGTPYDTLEKVVGSSKEDIGSLYDEGVSYREVDLKDDTFDTDAILEAITEQTKVIGIQRSRGYSLRASTTIDEIERSEERRVGKECRSGGGTMEETNDE